MTVSDSLLRLCTGLLLGLTMLFLGPAAQAQKVLDPYQIKRKRPGSYTFHLAP